MNIDVIKPIAPGKIQESRWMDLEKNIMYGDSVLPVVPIALAHPNAKLLTFVGKSSAM